MQIIKAKTRDNVILHALYSPAKESKTAVLHTHGTGGSFYWNNFYPFITKTVNESGWTYLAFSNRGSGVYEREKGDSPRGISLEIFEDCLLDFDAWIEYLLSQGIEQIVLEGHSFGIGKVTYYMAKGKYRDKIVGVIYLGTNGVYQTQMRYLKQINKEPDEYLKEAKKLIKDGHALDLLSDPFALAGYYPASAQTYVNFFTPMSEMYKSTQMATKVEGGYRHMIKIPLLWILGDKQEKEYLFVPFEKAFELVRTENAQVQIEQLTHCDHGLNGHEAEVAKLIASFILML